MHEREPAPVFGGTSYGHAFEGLLRELAAERLSREAERSLWLNHLVAAKIVQDPDRALTIALRNLDAMEANTRFANPWLDRWRVILHRGPDAAVSVLVSRHPEAVEMRQNTPFAGVIGARERAKVLEAFRHHWRRLHATGPQEAHAEADRSAGPR